MNKKINTICFIFLLLFLISAVSAANSENETIVSTEQPNSIENLRQINVDTNEIESSKLKSNIEEDKLQAQNIGVEKLSATATKKKITINAPNVKMYYKDGKKFTATLKYNKMVIANAKIQIKIDGKTYTKTTDNKGQASIDLNLKSGTYTVLTSCTGNNEFSSASAKSTVTIKSTIKCSDLTKYYKNTASYFATFYDKKGKLLKNTNTNFKLNSKTYIVKTNSKGVAKLVIDLKPGKYSIVVTNSKTSEAITKTVNIKSWIETKDMTLDEGKKGVFNVKILNSYGKVSPNKKVTIKVNGKTYTKTTNKNGIATLDINLDVGKYTITTEYSGLKTTNKITVNKIIKTTKFTHTTLIPDHVNVTLDFVFKYASYSLKSGFNGIVKMPKNELYIIEVNGKNYLFSNVPIDGVPSKLIGHESHLIPFDGSGIKSDVNNDNLKENGIVISRINGFTQIDYQSKTSDNVELFGFYASKGNQNSEILTYMQNDKITAKVNFFTDSFDEFGIRYSLAKYYLRSIYDFDYKSYDELTNHEANHIRFTNTNKPVTFSYFGKNIVGYNSKENIITKFIVNNKEESTRQETISYGLGENYRNTVGFEVLQCYSIITEKITQQHLKNWIGKDKTYLNKFGIQNILGMHLTSLQTAFIADTIANEYAKEYSLSWKRNHALTILSGINMDNSYLDILNADMGMDIAGNDQIKIALFKLINSLKLPEIEDYALSIISQKYLNETSNSLSNVLLAVKNNKYSMTQIGELIFILSEDGTNSSIIFNSSSGVANVITFNDNNIYKGSITPTTKDCCTIPQLTNDIINNIEKFLDNVPSMIDKIKNKAYPISKLAFELLKKFGPLVKGTIGLGASLVATMAYTQDMAVKLRDNIIDEKDWHRIMDTVTFTRPGALQGKKIYNIPNGKGGYDYIEIPIKDDFSLDRNNAIYISDGKTKKLTKQETDNYIGTDYWSAFFNMPTKYWKKPGSALT